MHALRHLLQQGTCFSKVTHKIMCIHDVCTSTCDGLVHFSAIKGPPPPDPTTSKVVKTLRHSSKDIGSEPPSFSKVKILSKNHRNSSKLIKTRRKRGRGRWVLTLSGLGEGLKEKRKIIISYSEKKQVLCYLMLCYFTFVMPWSL